MLSGAHFYESTCNQRSAFKDTVTSYVQILQAIKGKKDIYTLAIKRFVQSEKQLLPCS
jgi:hypothetical protein